MNFTQTNIKDVLHITPKRFGDARGWFMESWRHNAFEEAVGHRVTFVQDNHSYSAEAHTVRGLHYQSPPFAQGKLVRCTRGTIIDVAVDFRKNSPSFGQWVSAYLSAENGEMLWVPEGFLHGFSTLNTDTEVQYKCTNYYNGEADGNIAWDDSTLSIDWGVDHGFVPVKAVLSDKDKIAPKFNASESPF
jgi:dTDP-4-dehydrorhamnose 3,5-epimerase